MISDLYLKLKKLNVSIHQVDGRLDIKAAKGVLTEDLLEEIAYHKEDLVAFIDAGKKKKKTHLSIPQSASAPHYALSSAQRRLWVLSQFEGGNAAYNIPSVYEFEGMLNVAALKYCFEQLISRHEILRTIFCEDEQGEIRQFILAPEAVSFEVGSHDLQEQTDLLKALVQEKTTMPFNLSRGLLLRADLYQLAENKWVFTYVMHHIISDGWSMDVLMKELLLLYNAHLNGKANSLSPLRIQYKDYASWQQEALTGKDLKGHESYWLKQFEGSLPVLEFPSDRMRPPVKTYNGGVITRLINTELGNRLREYCQSEDSTLFMGLLAVINTILFKYTNQEDLIIGSPVAGREHIDLENQIGFYANTLALRTRFKGNDSFRDLLQRVKDVTLGGYRHQVYPFDELVDTLNLKRDQSRSALFDVMLVVQQTDGRATAGQQLGELKASRYTQGEQTNSKFDLTFFFGDSGKGLGMAIEYNSDIYNKSTIARLSAHVEQLLTAVMDQPEVAIDTLDYLSATERNTLLIDFNNTSNFVANSKSIVALFEEQAVATPDNVAVVFENTSLTYRELNEYANQLAGYLRDCYDMHPNDLAGIKQERSEWMIISILGVLKSGGAYVPIDLSYPQDRIDYLMSDSGCKVLLDDVEISRFVEIMDYYSKENLPVQHTADDLAYVIYTSGSTGLPKGCAITHSNLTGYIQWASSYYFETPDVNFGLYTSLSFDLTVTSIFCPLILGGKLYVYPQQDDISTILAHSFRGESFINTIKLTPSHINILKHLQIKNNAIRYAIVGGEQVTTEQVSILKNINPGIRIYNEYGPTETTVGCIIEELHEQQPILIGKPIAATRIYILDEKQGVCPVGVPGEICIAGSGVGREYLNKPILTAAKFVTDPFMKDERMYKTGDVGRWLPDGRIEYIGRKDDQVKIRGYRIELGEIESALVQHPLINAASVICRTGAEGDKELVGYITAGEALDIPGIRYYLNNLLPAYMHPTYFVQLDALPLTVNGKVDRKALPAPEGLSLTTTVAYEAPRNETEEKLVLIWQEILGKDKIGIKDNFFDLGGHSLKMMRVAARIHKTFEVNVSIKDLFVTPVLEEQALMIQQARKTLFVTLAPAPVQSDYPLSSAQRRLWVLSQFEEGSIAYNMPGVRIFEGNLDCGALEYAFQQLITRHESLRTTFKEDEQGEVKQHIHAAADTTFSIQYRDLRDEMDQEVMLKSQVHQAATEPFNLTDGPLLRAALYQVSDNKWVFSYVMHHIISDGWSMEILVHELMLFYNVRTGGYDDMLAPLHIQYKDYACWQQEQLKGESLEEHRSYWLDQFSGELSVLDMPADNPRPLIKTYNGGAIRRSFDKQLTKGIKTLLQEQGATLFMGLMAMVNTLLYKYTHQEDIIIGSPAAGRDHADLDGQIGFYVNTLALRTRFNGENSYKELLENIRQVTLGAYAHQTYPFDELVDELQLKHDMSRSPLFDVMLVLQHSGNHKEADQVPGELKVSNYKGGEHVISKFDLTFYFMEMGEELGMGIEYNSDLYSKETIERLAHHFERLIGAVLAQPGAALNSLDCLGGAEKQQLLHAFNDTRTTYPSNSTIIELFEEQVIQTPDAIALIFEDKSYTYQALNEQANQLGHYLRNNYDVTADDLIGIQLDRSAAMAIAILGVLKSGGGCVPVDIELPQERIDYILTNSNCKAVINSNELAAAAGYKKENLPSVNSSVDLAYVIYTSGSTGVPKGCMLENKGIINHLYSKIDQLGLNRESVICHNSALHFVGGIWQLLAPLVTGGKVVLCNNEELRSIDKLLQLANTHHAAVLEVIPSQLNEYLSYTPTIQLGCVKTLILTGERLNTHFVNKCYQGNEDLKIINTYGQTEFSDVTNSYNIPRHNDRQNVLIGRPIQNTRTAVLSPGGALCPIGVVGEICTSGDGLCRGYLNQP
ncbi:amino acid adenylation domain-containing protein, partial [Chitinophaga sp. CF118]|uniref:non-ribosomal peptide synthetase n=1 Tax=Chitinophaga sp. CF118 TaxID=1884367 RepID=UPI0008E1397A